MVFMFNDRGGGVHLACCSVVFRLLGPFVLEKGKPRQFSFARHRMNHRFVRRGQICPVMVCSQEIMFGLFQTFYLPPVTIQQQNNRHAQMYDFRVVALVTFWEKPHLSQRRTHLEAVTFSQDERRCSWRHAPPCRCTWCVTN